MYIKLYEEYIDNSIEDIIDLIKTNCAPIIEELKSCDSRLLYRGTSKYVNKIAEFQVRKDRKPRSMKFLLSKEIDDGLFKKFGVRPRSEGVFVTFDRNTSGIYGNEYIFFPIGEYKYVFSPVIRDSYIRIKDVREFDIIKHTYIDENLKYAIDKGVEISFICDKYYLIDRKYERDIQMALFEF